MSQTINTIGVLGTGTMGAGIVQVAAQAGYSVVACDRSVEALEGGQRYVREGLEKFAAKGRIIEEADTVYERVEWTTDFSSLAGADAAIEVIVERAEPKKEAFAALEALLADDALLLTNTSSISKQISPRRPRTPGASAARTSSLRRRYARPSRSRAAITPPTRRWSASRS